MSVHFRKPTFNKASRRSNHALRHKHAYQARIETLKNHAEMDDIVVREKSEQDFWAFIRSMPMARRANVVVTDDGNLRIVWRRGSYEHLGIEFLGDQNAEYVMWRTETLEPTAGRDTLDGIIGQIKLSGLTSILE